jgi:hypothetical protein
MRRSKGTDPNRQWNNHRTRTARETYPNPCEESDDHALPPDITGARRGARGSKEPSRKAPAPGGEDGEGGRVAALPGMDGPSRQLGAGRHSRRTGGSGAVRVRVRLNCWERRASPFSGREQGHEQQGGVLSSDRHRTVG